MAVAVAQLQCLDLARAGFDGVADRLRSNVRKGGLPILPPRAVQGLEPGRGKRLACSAEALVELGGG